MCSAINLKKILIFIFLINSILLSGCSSLSKSPRACEEAVKNELYPKPISIFADFFLFRDCSFSKNLRYESGEYYQKNKKRIMEELGNQWDNYNYVSYLGELFGCNVSDVKMFKEFLVKNKIDIFGTEELPVEPRNVMLNIGQFILRDDYFSKTCK